MIAVRAAVIGLGLIGGSLAASLRRSGAVVRGFDADPRASESARALGLVDELAGSLDMVVDAADLVVLCTPLSALLELLPRVDSISPPSALIMDVGSVKRPVVAVMERLEGTRRAIGGHPLAGSEQSGVFAARPDLFVNHRFILTPSTKTDVARIEQAADVARMVGATPVIMSADRHDVAVAHTSHLPQLLASTLAASLNREDFIAAGPGFRDMTRLAASDPELWRDILLLNAGNVVDAAREFAAIFQDLVYAVQRRDGDDVAARLRQGREAHRQFMEAA